MSEPLRLDRRVTSHADAERRSSEPSELRDFLMVLRQALLMIVRYIEKRYDL